MAYGSVDEVQQLMAQLAITITSTPTLLQVTALVDDISNEIDVNLSGAGVLVPVTTPQFFLDWLGRLNAYGAVAATLKSAVPGDENASAFWEQRYQSGLAGIRNGSMVPDTAVQNTNAVQPSTYLTRNPDTEESLGEIAEPLFKVGAIF